MHTISSYRGNRPTNKQHKTHRQDRLQYTALLASAQCKEYYGIFSWRKSVGTAQHYQIFLDQMPTYRGQAHGGKFLYNR